MLSYELALKLKEAGFPQNPFKKGDCPCVDSSVENNGTWVCQCSPDKFITIPSLSELIEACGEHFNSLSVHPFTKVWTAFSVYTALDAPKSNGNTPEEAVARLWLELNK